MAKFDTRIAIEASVERVWQVIAEVQRWPEWTESVTRVELLDTAPLAVGARVRILQPKLQPAVWTITEWQPNRQFVWVSHNPGLTAVAYHCIEPNATGCTLILQVQYQGLLGGVVGFFARDLTQKYMALEANGAKARSEGKK